MKFYELKNKLIVIKMFFICNIFIHKKKFDIINDFKKNHLVFKRKLKEMFRNYFLSEFLDF